MSDRLGGLVLLNVKNNDYNILTDSAILNERLKRFKKEKIVEYSEKVHEMRERIKDYALVLDKANDKEEIIGIKNSIEYLQGQIDVIVNNIKTLTTPTVANIEETHTLFVNYKYKPFVACGFEYQKTNAPSMPKLGTQTEISIPKYGDFFSDMVLFMELSDLAAVHPSNKVRYCNFLGHRLL